MGLTPGAFVNACSLSGNFTLRWKFWQGRAGCQAYTPQAAREDPHQREGPKPSLSLHAIIRAEIDPGGFSTSKGEWFTIDAATGRKVG